MDSPLAAKSGKLAPMNKVIASITIKIARLEEVNA